MILCREDTSYPADSVEFCPHSSFYHILACGTYQLETPNADNNHAKEEDSVASSAPQRRVGRCFVYAWNEDLESLFVSASLCFTSSANHCAVSYIFGNNRSELHCFDQPAILDMKWSVRYSHGHAANWSSTFFSLFSLFRSHDNKHPNPLLAIANAEGRIDFRRWHSATVSLGMLPESPQTRIYRLGSSEHTRASPKLVCRFKQCSMFVNRLVWTPE